MKATVRIVLDDGWEDRIEIETSEFGPPQGTQAFLMRAVSNAYEQAEAVLCARAQATRRRWPITPGDPA